MGMTNKEETLDWLYRLRSKIYVYMPKELLMPMNNALDVAIDTVKREEMLEDWTKKCRKFETDYENRLKADMVAMLEDLKQDIIAESWGLSAFVEDSKDLVVDVSDIDKVFYERITALKEQE